MSEIRLTHVVYVISILGEATTENTTMRKPIPRIYPFDNRSPDKHTLYPMPLPAGPRVVARTDGKTVDLWSAGTHQTTGSLNGFAPHIEDALLKLYDAMLDEPLPGITVNGKRKYSPGIVFDLILHDRKGDGEATLTENLLAEWSLDDEWPAPEDAVCAFVLATMPLEAFERGRDDCDLWVRRSHLIRGCARIGAGNHYANPHPVIRPATLAPDDWMMPAYGCAGRNGKGFWRQVENCFQRGFRGCLIIDVMQPWDIRGNAFQLITEEDYL